MSQEEKYKEIMEVLKAMIPAEITGKRRNNLRANIRRYVQRELGLREANPYVRVLVHKSVREKVDELLLELA